MKKNAPTSLLMGKSAHPLKSAWGIALLFASTILLSNCSDSIEGGGFVGGPGPAYGPGFYENSGPDLYIFGDGFYGGRGVRDFGRRGFESRDFASRRYTPRGGGYAHGGGGYHGGRR